MVLFLTNSIVLASQEKQSASSLASKFLICIADNQIRANPQRICFDFGFLSITSDAESHFFMQLLLSGLAFLSAAILRKSAADLSPGGYTRNMALVVIGGHSRSVGKTSVVAGLIAALPEFNWTALKITQYGHGICSANGKPCGCVTDDHTRAITEERDRSGETDTSRFLVAGARHSIWVRTRQGMLDQAMPDIRRRIAGAENVIMESNSIVRYLKPDLYLTVLDAQNMDFKDSAREFLSRADAVILHRTGATPQWHSVSLASVDNRPFFFIQPPDYVTPEMVEFVKHRIVEPVGHPIV